MITEAVGLFLEAIAGVQALRWQDEGVCKETDPDAFFPDDNGDKGAAAKRICADCPALIRCFDWGVRHEKYGIWGGTGRREREQLRRELGIAEPAEEDEDTA